MRAMIGKEESVFGFLSGVLVDEEGARSGGEHSEPERMAPSRPSLGVIMGAETDLLDPEVPAKAIRRRFSAKYKMKILKSAEDCKGIPGAIGALLRREGLYSSHLTTWKKQSEDGKPAILILKLMCPQAGSDALRRNPFPALRAPIFVPKSL